MTDIDDDRGTLQPNLGARIRNYLAIRSKILLVVCAVAVLLGNLGSYHRYLDLFAHMQVHYAMGLTAIAACLLWGRTWRWAIPAVLLWGVTALPLAPWVLHHCYFADGEPLEAVLFNVYTANPNRAELLAYLEQQDADIVVLQEVDGTWVADLAPLEKRYPNRIVLPRSDNFGIALYSKIPINAQEVLHDFGIPSIRVRCGEGEREFTLWAVHTLPPMSEQGFQERNEHLAMVGEYAKNCDTPLVVLGDLNVTMWSPWYRKLVQNGKLRNTRIGYGVLPTWPSFYGPFGIPLDHCLVRGLGVMGCHTGPALGSDHRPLVAMLTY